MVFIPGSIGRGIKLTKHGCVNINDNDKAQLETVIKKYHIYTEELTISYYNCTIWPTISDYFNSIRSLTLSNVRTGQECMISLIDRFTNLDSLILEHFCIIRWGNGNEIEIGQLPNSLNSLQLRYNSNSFYQRYRIIDLLNTHQNLKFLRVEHERLFERLMSPYPSLEHLVIRLSKQSTQFQHSLVNLENLKVLDLLYPSLNYSLIESILNLASIEELGFNTHIDPYRESDMPIINCPQLKKLSVRSLISAEWTEFFLLSCPNLTYLKLPHNQNFNLLLEKPELIAQLNHITLTSYTPDSVNFKTLLLSQNLKKMEIIASSVSSIDKEFFDDLEQIENWKLSRIGSRIILSRIIYN
ncbi:hypothetical protein CONCODRAFT_69966 [Conidiobolus coronatus NRRL 28638]|uniref:RNI-like protein n=1 Tax=Conidiobolus coronatus (strain ATCC 28846 / CBS 209.66 / NRRL 28638) TaxID=796925 RepID=A0A137P8R2_CONC2|nr:hypothetical protein CONCODRAFT_69966 [Conidiobolus coronatus NRRL 28638]|eukprot:KXN71311.1 hypothetical protein CONCODRAFT_69966 [Conidiobolus coronatus NRRL 28638]